MDINDSDDHHRSNEKLWWTCALVLSSAVLLGRRGFVHYVEQGESAAQIFALRARSLPYITVWAWIAIAAVALAFVHDGADGIVVAGIVFGQFVAVCLWRDYFANSDFITECIIEHKQRLKYLLTRGLGLNDMECEEFCRAVEVELVEFWRRNLRSKKWSDLKADELGRLFFASGVESGKVMTRALWEGVLFDVAAFFREWQRGVSRVRVPSSVMGAVSNDDEADTQACSCVGIILANESRELRETRDGASEEPTGLPPLAARTAQRKAAAEGILQRPTCLSYTSDIEIERINWNADNLYISDRKGHNHSCSEDEISFSVKRTLEEMIQAGYFIVSPEGTIHADVIFKYANMVFRKDDWNQMGMVERKPFRYVTSATWMSGDPAFMVERREIRANGTDLDGSGFLEGVLRLEVNVNVRKQQKTWLEQAEIRDTYKGSWGNISDFVQPRGVCFLNWPVLWIIQSAWIVAEWIACFYRWLNDRWHGHKRPLASMAFNQSTHRIQGTCCRITADEKRDSNDILFREESSELRNRYQPDRNRKICGDDHALDADPSSSETSNTKQQY